MEPIALVLLILITCIGLVTVSVILIYHKVIKLNQEVMEMGRRKKNPTEGFVDGDKFVPEDDDLDTDMEMGGPEPEMPPAPPNVKEDVMDAAKDKFTDELNALVEKFENEHGLDITWILGEMDTVKQEIILELLGVKS